MHLPKAIKTPAAFCRMARMAGLNGGSFLPAIRSPASSLYVSPAGLAGHAIRSGWQDVSYGLARFGIDRHSRESGNPIEPNDCHSRLSCHSRRPCHSRESGNPADRFQNDCGNKNSPRMAGGIGKAITGRSFSMVWLSPQGLKRWALKGWKFALAEIARRGDFIGGTERAEAMAVLRELSIEKPSLFRGRFRDKLIGFYREGAAPARKILQQLILDTKETKNYSLLKFVIEDDKEIITETIEGEIQRAPKIISDDHIRALMTLMEENSSIEVANLLVGLAKENSFYAYMIAMNYVDEGDNVIKSPMKNFRDIIKKALGRDDKIKIAEDAERALMANNPLGVDVKMHKLMSLFVGPLKYREFLNKVAAGDDEQLQDYSSTLLRDILPIPIFRKKYDRAEVVVGILLGREEMSIKGLNILWTPEVESVRLKEFGLKVLAKEVGGVGEAVKLTDPINIFIWGGWRTDFGEKGGPCEGLLEPKAINANTKALLNVLKDPNYSRDPMLVRLAGYIWDTWRQKTKEIKILEAKIPQMIGFKETLQELSDWYVDREEGQTQPRTEAE